MSSEIFAELKGNGEIQPVFEGLQIQAELRETLSITTITQSYRNAGSKNIETVYTFPLPLDAVLLEMTVMLGDKILKGTVLPKQKAEEKYEKAIIDGDAPVMLQNNQPGIYTMNVGNFLPGEKARITIRYGMFQRWQGDTLRYHLPTTIAPRYGLAEQAGLETYQEPETSLLAENLFSFELKVCGTLAGMSIASPSHEITVERNSEGEESIVKLVKKTAFMDRDLIISVKKSSIGAATALMERDGDEYLVWGGFQPHFDLADNGTLRSVKILVDCSGSMEGDSIAQAREALLRVLDELRPQDWFNVIAFGSTATPLFNAQSKADKESLAYARGFLKKLAANMGGTEIGRAIEMAVRLRCPEQIQQDVLLITDGEIWEWEKIVAKAQKSKHRFFTVGVGSSVSEAFVRTLADRTGGACELVSPTENMADRIHRHFKRIGAICSKGNEVIWPAQPLRAFPEELPSIYDGDTCNMFAWFDKLPTGNVGLKISLPNSAEQILTATIEQTVGNKDSNKKQEAAVARMAAALKLREITEEKIGQELAVKYQLMSRWTNYLAIVIREEDGKAENLPELHKVQQMLVAGWGGFGSILYSASDSGMRYCRSSQSVNIDLDTPKCVRDSNYDKLVTKKSTTHHQSAPLPYDTWLSDDHLDTMERFIELLDMTLKTGTMPTTINLPLLPDKIKSVLKLLLEEGFDERTIVATFLHYLAISTVGNGLSRQAKRVIGKAHKDLKIDQGIAKTIEKRLEEGMDEDKYDIPSFLRKCEKVGNDV